MKGKKLIDERFKGEMTMHSTSKEIHFKIIIPMYNAEKWIEQNIRVIQGQRHGNFQCIIIDDLSTDTSAALVKKSIKNDSRFLFVQNREKRFSLGNVYHTIQRIDPDDEDVIVLVDADDRLAHEHVLSRLAAVYANTGCWMTYGSYSDPDGTVDRICRAYPTHVIDQNRFRQVKWRASHLKTFKCHLWRKIDPNDFSITEQEIEKQKRCALLRFKLKTWYIWQKVKPAELVDPSGRFIRRCVDKAMTYPLLEMAGPKAQFVEEILYIYNFYKKELPYGDRGIDAKWYTRLIRSILKDKPQYSMIPGPAHT